MSQLQLSKTKLKKIGFIEKIYPGEKEIPGLMPAISEKITYEIPCLNGCFYYNENEIKYRWYQRINVGENSHYTHLNIESLPELITLLSIFSVVLKSFYISEIDGCEVFENEECPICKSPLEDNGYCSDVGNNNCHYVAGI